MIKPCGYQILIKPYRGREKIGSIMLPDTSREVDRIACVCAQVVDMGPDAYQDESRFKTPWAKVGDWIVIGKMVGTRFMIEDEEYRLINDDQVLATVDDPDKVTRVM